MFPTCGNAALRVNSIALRLLQLVMVAWMIASTPILQAAETLPAGRLTLSLTGPPVAVFRHATQACDALDIPDAPARAIRVGTQSVQLYAPHFVNRRMTGRDLLHLAPDCRVVYRGAEDDDPADFDDRGWIASLSTHDGVTIHAIVHDEFQGHRRAWLCPSGRYMDCWYNALIAATSHDSGQSFHRDRGSAAVIASLPTRYEATVGTHVGYFNPTGMVDLAGTTYMMAFATTAAVAGQEEGNCLLRTTDVVDPKAWRAWDGAAFTVRFANPYLAAVPAGTHVCVPVGMGRLRWPVTSLVRHVSGTFVAVMMDGAHDGGVYAATSDDLVHWSEPSLLMAAEGPGTWRCGDPLPLAYPSLLDPSSTSPDFRTVGDTAMLFVVRFNEFSCRIGMNRDLLRIPVLLHDR